MWRFGYTDDSSDQLDWDEGNSGKGVIDADGHVYTWNDDDWDLHQDFLADHPDIRPMYLLYVEPNGQVELAYQLPDPTVIDTVEDILREADPRLHLMPADTWRF